MEPDDRAAHGVAQVERLLRTIRADPSAPRLVAVTGPGGSGKSLALRSVRTLYARGGDGAPLIVDDVHALGDDAVRKIVAAAHMHTIRTYGPDRIAGFSPIRRCRW